MKQILYITFCFSLFSCVNTQDEASNEHKEITYLQLEGYAQGTTYHIVYKDSLNRNLQAEIDRMLRVVDSSVSNYKPYSLITQFSELRDTTTWFQIDNIFFQNLMLSKHIHQETEGAFDPTVGPLFSNSQILTVHFNMI